MSKDHKLNTPAKGNYGLGNTTGLAFQLSNKKLSSSESIFDKEANVGGKSSLKKSTSHDDKNHKIKIKTVFNLPNNSHGGSSVTQEFYDPFNPTEDEVEHENPPPPPFDEKKDDVYDPFNPTYSDESESDLKSPPNVEVPSPEPLQDQDDEAQSPANLLGTDVFGTFSKPQEASSPPENVSDKAKMDVDDIDDDNAANSPTHDQRLPSPLKEEEKGEDSNKYKWAEDVLTKITSTVNKTEEEEAKVEEDVDIFADEDSKKEAVNETSPITGKVKLPSFKLGQDSSDIPPVKFKKLSKKPKVSVSDDKEEFDEEESALPSLTVKSTKSKSGEGKGSRHKDKEDHKELKRKHSKDHKRSPSPSHRKRNRHRSKSPRRNRHSRSRSKSVKRKRRSRSKSKSPHRRRRSTRSRSNHRRRKASTSRSPRRRRSRSRSKAKQRRRSRRSSSRSRRKSKSRSSSRRRRRSPSKDKKSRRKSQSQSQRKSESEQISKKEISLENKTVELEPSPEVIETPKLPDVTQELKTSDTVEAEVEVPKSPVKEAVSSTVPQEEKAISNVEAENKIEDESMDIENVESTSPIQVSRWLPIPETKEEPKAEPEVFHTSVEHDTIDIFNSSPVASSKHDKHKESSVKKSSKRKKKKKKSSRSDSPTVSKKESKNKSPTSKEVFDENVKPSQNKEISKLDTKNNDKAKLLEEKAKLPSPTKNKTTELPSLKEESTKHKKKKHKKLEKTNSSDSQRQKTPENLPKEKTHKELKADADAKELELIAERVRSKKSKYKLEIKETKTVKEIKPTPSTSKVNNDKSHDNEDEIKISKKKKKKKHSSKTEHYSSDEQKPSDKKHKTKKQKKKKKSKHHGRSDDFSDKEDTLRVENKKSKDKKLAKDEQNTLSDFDEIDAALDSALSSGKKHKKDKKKKRRASKESLEDLNESLSKPKNLFEDLKPKLHENDHPLKIHDEKYLPAGFEDSPKSGNEKYSPQLFEDEPSLSPKEDPYDIEDFFPLTKSPVKMDVDQSEDVESPVASPVSEHAEIMKDSHEESGGVTHVENDDMANFDDDMFADSPYDPGDKTPEEKYESIDGNKNTSVEQHHEQLIIGDEKRTNVTSLVDIFDLNNDSIQEPHENNQSEQQESPKLHKQDNVLPPDDVYAAVSLVEEKPLQSDNITEELTFKPPLHETNNNEDIEPLQPDVKVNVNEDEDPWNLTGESGIQEEHLQEEEEGKKDDSVVVESLDVVENIENKSIKDENESKKSKSDSKSSRSRRRSRSKSKESRRKSRSKRSRSRDKGRNDRSRARRSKSRERRKSHRSKSKERKRSTSRSRDRRRSRSKSRDRRRHDNHSRRRHSRSPRRRQISRSKTPPRRSKRTPEKRSPRRRSRRKSEKSPSPWRHKKSPLLSMESVTLKSLKTKAAEPQQISTISGISSLANKKSHHHHMNEYPDDVPEVMVSAASTNQTALRTLVDVSTNHTPPPSTSLIQIQTIQEPVVKKVESPPSIHEEELSPPPPPPPPPKLPSPKKHVHKVAINGNEDGKKHETHKEKDILPDDGKESENGGVTAILNFIGLNPQEKSAAQNAILSIAELSKRLQLDKIVEGGTETTVAVEDMKPPPAPPIPDEEEVLSPISIDNIESSAVELFNKDKKVKYVQKLKFRDRVVEEAKQAIKPFYEKREINKEEYKDIMKRAVNKICSNEAGSYEVNNVKIRRLIRRYIAKYQERNQKKKEKMRIKLEGKYHSSALSQPLMDDFDDAPSPPENLDSITIPVTTPTLLKREPRKVVTLPDLPLPPPPPPPKPKYWK